MDIRKILFGIIAFLLVGSTAMGQSHEEDWTYDKDAVKERKLIPHRYTREANVKFHKRIHRVIDTREKQNLVMHWPTNPFFKII